MTAVQLGLAAPVAGAQARDGVLAFVNANVVDVAAGRSLADQVVVVRDGRIVTVGGRRTTPVPADARRVDVRGGWVIPGLWDMHVHSSRREQAWLGDVASYYGALFLANGVTGVRDVGGDADLLQDLDALGRSEAAFPRLVYTGQKIGGRPVVRGAPPLITSVKDLRKSLGALRARGIAFGKLSPELPLALFRAAMAECAAQGMRCVTHVPATDTAQWLSVPGRGSYEHLFNIEEQVSRVTARRVFAAYEEYERPRIWQRVLYKLRLRDRPREPVRLRLAMRDTTKDEAFFRAMAYAGNWITPTLLLHRRLTQTTSIVAAAADPLLTLEPPEAESPGGEGLALRSAQWSRWTGIVRAMNRYGVQLLAGTDFFVDNVPGASLVAELVLLQDAGLSPLEALRTATTNPARYLAAQDTLGAVRAGFVADLVVLRADPLHDIRNLQQVDAVVARGRLFTRASLDSLRRLGASAALRIKAPG